MFGIDRAEGVEFGTRERGEKAQWWWWWWWWCTVVYATYAQLKVRKKVELLTLFPGRFQGA